MLQSLLPLELGLLEIHPLAGAPGEATHTLAANVTIETPSPGLEVLAALCRVPHTSTGSSGAGRGRVVWQEIIQADASPCVPEIESEMLNQLNRFRSASAVIMKGGRG